MIQSKSLFVLVLLLAMSPTDSYAQSNDPIEKRGLIAALNHQELSSKDLIEQVQKRGVAFRINETDERDIRRVGKYLRKRGLDSLLAAIRDNYRPKTASPSTSAITQTMTNSPGGIQAGGNVTINPLSVPRRIPEASRPQIIAMLSQKTAKVEVLPPSGDNEAIRLAADIHEALTKAGWDMQGKPVGYLWTLGLTSPEC